MVVETADAVLVASKDRVQDVKAVVDQLKASQRPEGRNHRKVYRPWGCYDSIDFDRRFQVKRIMVNPGACMSSQMHHHRAEHWVVVNGTARVPRGDEVFLLTENQSTYIPVGVRHRLTNPGKIPLEIIEVQSGSYLGEDDIVRFEDVYGRGNARAEATMSTELACFKAYDIRGRIPDELNEDLAYRIGRAYAALLQPRRVAVGHDVRLTSPALSAAVAKGLLDGGADVLDIGLCGTEEIYFAAFHHRLDGGIMVTASHNPMDYNGMKLVREQAKPISGDSGLFAIRDLAARGEISRIQTARQPGSIDRTKAITSRIC